MEGEATYNRLQPYRLKEYDQIFRASRALTEREHRLLKAVEHPADWAYLKSSGYLDGDPDGPAFVFLTPAASNMLYAIYEILDRLDE